MADAYRSEETRICFPSAPSERRVDEGPFARARIVHAMAGGARYELARFDLPQALPQDKRRVLMRRVVKGLVNRPDIEHVEAGTIAANGVVTRALSMRLRDQRMGVWWLSFPTPRQMLQVSVIGPAASRPSAERFLRTLGSSQCSGIRSDDQR